ncbi:MAG TPA: hypothetical protein VFR15_16770 [Chloroflexia bacterium]|nr:hypothetical protein [Chloroflexia bacterium]
MPESPPSPVDVTPDAPRHGDTSIRPRLWHRRHLGALLAHVGLSVLFTWPLVLNFLPGAGTTTPGFMRVDRNQNLWNLWWTREALLAGRNPFVTDMIWYPEPQSLYYHTLNVFNGIAAIPLLSVLSLPTTYNVIVLLSFVLTGWGAFLLVHYVCGNCWAALAGSVVFAYSAYHIATMRGLLQLISLEWVPFFVLFLLKAVFDAVEPGRRGALRWGLTRALPAGFFLLLVTLVDWYYTLYSLMIAGLLGLYLLWRAARPSRDESDQRWATRLAPVVRLGAVIAVYLVLAAPLLIPTLRELRTERYMVPDPDAALRHSADLAAYFMPPRGHLLWGQAFSWRDRWPFGGDTYEVYFTYTALVLAGVGLLAVRRPRSDDRSWVPGRRFWAASGLVFFLLSLGPVLQVNGQQVRWLLSPSVPLVMPYRLLENLPVFNISRSPDRFDMPVTLCLALLVGYGVNALSDRLARGNQSVRPARGVSVAAVALIVVELMPFPYPQSTADVPRWYSQLAAAPGDYSILELPPQGDYWHGAYRMYFQTAHGKPTFGGYISREYYHPFLDSTPGFQQLQRGSEEADMFADGPDEWFSALERYRVRYVVLQKRREPERDDPRAEPDVAQSREHIAQVLGPDAEPVYEDEQLAAYAVASPERRVPFLSVGQGWQPREVGPNGAFRWMGSRATIEVEAPSLAEAYLEFRAAGLGSPRRLQVYHGEVLVFDRMIGGLQTFRTDGPLGLPEGTSTLTFVSPEGTVSPARLGLGDDPRQLSFALLDMRLDSVQK